MGFPENYADSLVAALENIPTDRPEYAELQKRLGLLEHSSGMVWLKIGDWSLLDDPEIRLECGSLCVSGWQLSAAASPVAGYSRAVLCRHSGY